MNLYANLLIAAIFVGVTVGAYFTGANNREKVVRGEYAKRDLQASEEARIAERGIAARERAKEQGWQQKFAQAGTKYQRSLDASATALLVADTVRLYDTGRPVQACGSAASETSSNPVATDPRGTELSKPFADFLRREAGRADQTAIKLNLCIDVLEAEREQ